MRKRRTGLVLLLLMAALVAAFFIYTGDYYRADDTAAAALVSDNIVSVERTGYGWRFDGPSDAAALIFYPGGKVEATAYAPLLRRVAEGGMDVCLVDMPFRLAVFGMGRADAVMAAHRYDRWFIGGHSLGGAMAASYAANHPEGLAGVALLAAYPVKPLDDSLALLSVYGTEDGVLDRAKLLDGDRFAPPDHREYIIEGGNHAQFGSYGRQRGDGEAAIPADEQQRQAAEYILQLM